MNVERVKPFVNIRGWDLALQKGHYFGGGEKDRVFSVD